MTLWMLLFHGFKGLFSCTRSAPLQATCLKEWHGLRNHGGGISIPSTRVAEHRGASGGQVWKRRRGLAIARSHYRARELLPETGLIFGRQSKPFSHFFYRSDRRSARAVLSIRWTRHDLSNCAD